jgi:5'-3' exonuclease
VAALGVVVWPMVEFEADDALATAAARFREEAGVEQVVLCSPDKDLAQAVVRDHVVCWDRRRDIVLDEAGVTGKFGVPPASIPDWLALVGDAADGFPGIPGWGAKSAAAVLARFGHLAAIPDDPAQLGMPAARAARLIESLRAGRDDASLFLRLATLRLDVPIEEDLAALEWRGVRDGFAELCTALGDPGLVRRVEEAGGLR